VSFAIQEVTDYTCFIRVVTYAYRHIKRGSHSGDYEEYCLLGSDAGYSGRSLPTFQRNVSPSSSRPNSKPRKQNYFESYAYCLLVCLLGLFFDPENVGSTFLRNVRKLLQY
jgi:hypothetical protein